MLLKEVNKHPYGEILLSFPGIGGVISATLIGIIKDINYWPDKRNLKKMLGVYGREYISGASPQKRRPGKGGNRIGKKVLFQACKACLRKNVAPNDFRDYYERQLKHNWVSRSKKARLSEQIGRPFGVNRPPFRTKSATP